MPGRAALCGKLKLQNVIDCIWRWSVNHFDIVQSFIERCEGSERVGDLVLAFQGALDILGFRSFACCSHVDPVKPPRRAIMLHNYPDAWVQDFSELDLHDLDPVFLHADRVSLPFFWDAPAFRAGLTTPQQQILAEASHFGIAHGYTVPIHSPHSPSAFRASCSVVPDSASIDARSYAAVQLMSCYLYDAASRDVNAREAQTLRPELSRRERQCLELAAQGKSDWVVGRILGISERTVHNHIESAKRRLDVATRVQAIVQALASRQISFGDLLKAEVAERSSECRAQAGSRSS
jgi:DNA-binding CsgD family transcriptional regulator